MIRFRFQMMLAAGIIFALIGTTSAFANHPDDLNDEGQKLSSHDRDRIDDNSEDNSSEAKNDDLNENGVKLSGDGLPDDNSEDFSRRGSDDGDRNSGESRHRRRRNRGRDGRDRLEDDFRASLSELRGEDRHRQRGRGSSRGED